MMAAEWWHKMVFPVRRVWVAVSARVKARKNVGALRTKFNKKRTQFCLNLFVKKSCFQDSTDCWVKPLGAGLLKLRDDIQTCGYEDVQVMWEMLRRTESELISSHAKRNKHRPFWRVFVWSNQSPATSFDSNPAH
ncbi:hypothetical protein M9H77_29154 [Catharanthus roseus]|uniref:Uncharacterized protein n=1 Tax=Catharanthus roseus TaxID=4058 RepID=A0ACC0ALI2_CATRO|nr:hypothetical protein M9H77_29154 [Catharanthus roseus]